MLSAIYKHIPRQCLRTWGEGAPPQILLSSIQPKLIWKVYKSSFLHLTSNLELEMILQPQPPGYKEDRSLPHATLPLKRLSYVRPSDRMLSSWPHPGLLLFILPSFRCAHCCLITTHEHALYFLLGFYTSQVHAQQDWSRLRLASLR